MTREPPLRTGPVRVLVVDDQAPYRDAVATLVSSVEGFDLVAAVDSVDGLDQLLDRTLPDLLLLDVRMPDGDGAEVAVRLRHDRPHLAVLLMSVFDSDEIPSEVHDAGVRFVEKENLDADTLLGMLAEIERRAET